MQRTAINAQRIRYQLRQLGWLGQLGLVLSFVAVVLLGWTQVNRKEANVLRLALNHPQQSLLQSAESREVTEDVVKHFYAVLPAQDDVNPAIAAILHTAERYGFVPDRSDYTENVVPEARMVRYQIKLPLIAPYVDIRKFIAEVMNAQPSIALNNVSFSRGDINEELVDANIEFALYTKTAGKQ